MAMLDGATTPIGFEGKGKWGILRDYKNKILGYNSSCASNDFAMKMILSAKNNRQALENQAEHGHIDIDS